MNQMPDFHGCPNASCSYGDWLLKGAAQIFSCEGCGTQYCIDCRVPMHLGESCAVYQARTKAAADGADLATQRYLSTNAVVCPNCGARINKTVGCNHITCEYTQSCDHVAGGANVQQAGVAISSATCAWRRIDPLEVLLELTLPGLPPMREPAVIIRGSFDQGAP